MPTDERMSKQVACMSEASDGQRLFNDRTGSICWVDLVFPCAIDTRLSSVQPALDMIMMMAKKENITLFVFLLTNPWLYAPKAMFDYCYASICTGTCEIVYLQCFLYPYGP